MSLSPPKKNTSGATEASLPQESMIEATKVPQVVVDPPDSSSSLDDGDVDVDATTKAIETLSVDPDRPSSLPLPLPPDGTAATADAPLPTTVDNPAPAAKKEKDVPFPKVGVLFSVFLKFIADNGGYDRFRGMTTTQVNDLILKPLTSTRKCSYCELLQHQR